MDQLQREHFLAILEKFQSGTATAEEMDFLNAYYKAFDLKRGVSDTLTDVDREKLKSEILGKVKDRMVSKPAAKARVISITAYLKIGAAAAILIMCIGAFLFSLHYSKPKQVAALHNDIAPGTNSATLTLGNGKKIVLAQTGKGTVATQAGVTISKASNGQLVYQISNTTASNENSINTLTTARGEQYQVILPDGSHVWLNAASSLKYPASFANHQQREVELSGEAYFEVAKDREHPFIVSTNRQKIEVLGTHFNVDAYNEEKTTKTTLLEGSVQVTAANGNKVKIKPGEQASLLDDKLDVKDTDPDAAVAWKNGYFQFNDEKLESVMRKLSRWYNIEVEYQGKMSEEGFNGAVSRFRNISQVLKMLEKTGAVHFKVEGRRVTIIQ